MAVATMTGRRTGRCKWFSAPKGFGFIQDLETNDEAFVHYSCLERESPGWKGLWPGEYVEYDVSKDDEERLTALKVRGIKNGSLMCEAPGNRPVLARQ